jgi:hypothetical protein
MTTKRNPRIDDMTDEELMCFVRWCRDNDERITQLPDLCRRVLKAYAGVRSQRVA